MASLLGGIDHLLLVEPDRLSPRAQDMLLLRMVPFVERNYNMVELGPRGTGKSHLYQQVSPYAHLISGGKTTVAKMFVNNANGQRGLVCRSRQAGAPRIGREVVSTIRYE